jgi:hypothetical protein
MREMLLYDGIVNTLAVGGTQQPIRNKLVFIGEHEVIAITAFADLEDVAG